MQSIPSRSMPLLSPALRRQGSIFLVALGHGATHWLLGTFLILLPFITQDFGLSYTQAGLLVFSLQVTSFVCNMVGGMVVDISGRRVVFLIACLLIGGAAMIGFGYSTLYVALVPLVMLVALSISFWHAPAVAFISSRFPTQRGYALSIHSTGASLGDMVAPGLAGVLLTWLTWHETAMVASLPAFLLALPIFILLMPGDSQRSGRSGVTDAAGNPPARAGMSTAQYLAGLKLMVRQMGMVGMCLMVALRGMAQSGLGMFLPLYLANELKVSPSMVGGTILAMHLGAVVMSPVAGIASDRMGRRPVVMAGLMATTVIIAGLTFLDSTALFVGGVSLLGFTLYSIRAVMQSWMIDLFPQELSGTATSIFFGVQAAFSAIMPLVGGLIADAYGLFEVFYLIAGVMLLSNLMIFLIPRDTK